MVEVNYALCLVYSSLGDQSGFEQGKLETENYTTSHEKTRSKMIYSYCLVYSSLSDQSGFEQGGARVIGLEERLPDVEFDGAGIPA